MKKKRKESAATDAIGCLLVGGLLVLLAAVLVVYATLPGPEQAREVLEERPVGRPAAEPAAHIMCKDGTRSPSCTSCERGCCSGHGGCR